MESYKIRIKKSAWDELTRIPLKSIAKTIEGIRLLALDPRPRGHVKLSAKGCLRIREWNYRIVYTVDDEVWIIQIEKLGYRRKFIR